MNTLQTKLGQVNELSVLFLLVDLCFSNLFINEIGKLRVMCGIPLIFAIVCMCNAKSN